jgi:hypothetical protein
MPSRFVSAIDHATRTRCGRDVSAADFVATIVTMTITMTTGSGTTTGGAGCGGETV